jgi:hypothetical protein
MQLWKALPQPWYLIVGIKIINQPCIARNAENKIDLPQ